MAYEVERQFEAAREAHSLPGAQNAFQIAVTTLDRPQPLRARAPTFGEVCERYMRDPTMLRSPKSSVVYGSTFTTIIAIVGDDLPFSSISRDACREVLGVLQRLPPNARKRWPDLSPREAASEAARLGLPPMSPANANEYMNKFSSLFNWAVKEELIHRNPAKGLRIAEPLNAREKRRPFAPIQLQRIFDAPLYRGCRDDENGYAVPGPHRPKRGRFWIPLIALFGGLRQGEICQLYTDDIRDVGGILCIHVCAGEGDGKRLKTNASHRLVPVHPTLLQIGFAQYVEDRRQAGDKRLFPELLPDSLGLYSGKFSKWFTRFLASCDAAAERTCFHAFRHSFRDALREAKIDRDVALTIGGWTTSSGSGGGSVADTYGSGYSPGLLYAAVAMIEYPELDLSHLFEVASG